MLNNTGLIILAAGTSSRLGESKQLLPFRGKTLLRHSVEAALASSCSPVIVVLGAKFEKHRAEIQNSGVEIVENTCWEEGLGSSISYGVKELLQIDRNIDSIILMVCDQPFMSSGIIKQLVTTYKLVGKGIIASSYSGTCGTPALFGKKYFNALQNLSPKKGAKKLFNSFGSDLEMIDFPLGEIDIDTKEDYNRLITQNFIENANIQTEY